MLPLIIAAGAAVVSTAAFFGLKSRCKNCESLFTLNETCLVCAQDVCGDCGVAVERMEYREWPVTPTGRTCIEHKSKYDKTIARLKDAIDKADSVEVFSKNYKGKAPNPTLRRHLETQFHTDRELAERELRILAALEGAHSVSGAEHIREKREDGNYTYSVWKLSGHI